MKQVQLIYEGPGAFFTRVYIPRALCPEVISFHGEAFIRTGDIKHGLQVYRRTSSLSVEDQDVVPAA